MTDKIKISETHKGDADKFVKIIDQLSKQAHESGLLDLDYLDQIPDDEIIDEPIPFPFGGHGDFGKWHSIPKLGYCIPRYFNHTPTRLNT